MGLRIECLMFFALLTLPTRADENDPRLTKPIFRLELKSANALTSLVKDPDTRRMFMEMKSGRLAEFSGKINQFLPPTAACSRTWMTSEEFSWINGGNTLDVFAFPGKEIESLGRMRTNGKVILMDANFGLFRVNSTGLGKAMENHVAVLTMWSGFSSTSKVVNNCLTKAIKDFSEIQTADIRISAFPQNIVRPELLAALNSTISNAKKQRAGAAERSPTRDMLLQVSVDLINTVVQDLEEVSLSSDTDIDGNPRLTFRIRARENSAAEVYLNRLRRQTLQSSVMFPTGNRVGFAATGLLPTQLVGAAIPSQADHAEHSFQQINVAEHHLGSGQNYWIFNVGPQSVCINAAVPIVWHRLLSGVNTVHVSSAQAAMVITTDKSATPPMEAERILSTPADELREIDIPADAVFYGELYPVSFIRSRTQSNRAEEIMALETLDKISLTGVVVGREFRVTASLPPDRLELIYAANEFAYQFLQQVSQISNVPDPID